MQVFMLPTDAVLDEQLLSRILASGHSRIPVHRPGARWALLSVLMLLA